MQQKWKRQRYQTAARKARAAVLAKRSSTRRRRWGLTKVAKAGAALNVHHFKRMIGNVATINGNAAYAPYVNSFGPITLSQVQTASDFTNLFDQYRLNFCVVKFYLKIDPSAQTAATASFPKLYWYRDFDDSAPPSNLAEMRENSRTKVAVMYPNRPVTIKFKPNALSVLYKSAIANQYSPKWGQWCSMSDPQTPHYGLKIAIDDLTNTNYQVAQEIWLYFSCKSTR